MPTKKKKKVMQAADTEGYFTVQEAAHALRVKTPTVRNYLTEGKLTSYKFKTLTLVAVEELKAWQGRRKKRL